MAKSKPGKTTIDVDEETANQLREMYSPFSITDIMKFLGETALSQRLPLSPKGGITILPKGGSQTNK